MPESSHVRIYLDSNVLFSASYNEQNRLLHFWRLYEVTLVVSPFAMAESRRHATRLGHSGRLESLLRRTTIVNDADIRYVPTKTLLAAKDLPTLAAAIAAKVDFLATGDKKHFSSLYGTTIGGVHISSPTGLLDQLSDRMIL